MTTKVSPGLVQDLSNPNLFINGDFSVNQREFAGALTASVQYTLDRFQFANGGTFANVSVNQGFAFPGASDSYIDVITGVTGSAFDTEMYQKVEGVFAAGKKVTVSFNALNYSDDLLDKTIKVRALVLDITGATIYAQTDFVDITIPHQDTQHWQGLERFSALLDIPSVNIGDPAVKNGFVRFDIRIPDSTKIQFAQYKVELGEVATPFVPDDQSTNLMKCQRYYGPFVTFYDRNDEPMSNGTRGGSTEYVGTPRSIPSLTIIASSGAFGSISGILAAETHISFVINYTPGSGIARDVTFSGFYDCEL